MDINITIGIILLCAALCVLVTLTIWSVKIINRIDRSGHRSARETLKEMQNER